MKSLAVNIRKIWWIIPGIVCALPLRAQTPPLTVDQVTVPSPVASIEPAQIQDWDKNPPEIKALLLQALAVTKLNLKYVYGSADPGQGGMDCSGTIVFILTQAGIANVPRQANEQYIWARKENLFRAVFSTSNDSFEFSDLVPGDLLFWTGTYDVQRDPPITHVMLYLGRRASDHQRIMIGASEGRYYAGTARHGVSVFDFQLPGFPLPPGYKNNNGAFIGYSRIPNFHSSEEAHEP